MAINPALLTMLMQQAPFLLSALKRYGGAESFPNITNSLDAGMDPNLMEKRLLDTSNIGQDYDDEFGINVLEHKYSNQETELPFPSDGNSQLDLQGLAKRLLNDPNNTIGDGGQPALMSAAIFQNNPELTTDTDTSTLVPGTDIPWSDEDMDALHQTEAWEDGLNYKNPKLVKWYKKNKR